MKPLLLSTLLVIGFFNTNAQKFEVGVHGGFGTTWMLNNNVSDQGDNLDYETSFGPVFGIHGGYFFPSRFGVVVEMDYAIDHQKYTGKTTGFTTTGNYDYDIADKFRYIEVPILLRKYSRGGFYFEIGPKFSFLSGAAETIETTPATGYDYADRNVKAAYKKMIVSAAFGIGSQFKISRNLYADARLRFAYGLTDATEKFSESDLGKKLQAGEIGIGTEYAHYDQQGKYGYKATNLATGYLMAGVTYVIPILEKKQTGSPL